MITPDESFVDAMAQLISQGEHVQLTPLLEAVDCVKWCSQCDEMHGMATVRMRGISQSGVHDIGTVRACMSGQTSCHE